VKEKKQFEYLYSWRTQWGGRFSYRLRLGALYLHVLPEYCKASSESGRSPAVKRTLIHC